MLKSHKKSIRETLGRNPIHPFPARMAPGIALEALGKSGTSLRVLDPMAGSGTVLAVARANGHRTFGVDTDPLAVLLAKVWTRPADYKRISEKAEVVLSRARSVFDSRPSRLAYPSGSDEETRKFIRFWFDLHARRQLASLATAIGRIHNAVVRDVLWCAFSRLIISKSSGASRAMDLSHSRPHRKFTHAPVKPFDRFLSAVKTVVTNCPQKGSESLGPSSTVKLGDARKLGIKSQSIDLVLTSPPYLNAIDYLRCSKFSLVWMGYNVSELRKIRSDSVGTEALLVEASKAEWVKSLIMQLGLKPALSNRDYGLLARYVWDMGQATSEVSSVLRVDGRAVYVVGDSTVKGTFIPNSKIVELVSQLHGLKLDSRQSRALPANRRYLPPPKRGQSGTTMDVRMRREVVMAFSKC